MRQTNDLFNAEVASKRNFEALDRVYTADARILPPPGRWGGKLPGEAVPKNTQGFDANTGRPLGWPMRLCKAHWAALLPGLAVGEYTFRCRTVDGKGQAQPMPRPFHKSGRSDIEAVKIKVVA